MSKDDSKTEFFSPVVTPPLETKKRPYEDDEDIGTFAKRKLHLDDNVTTSGAPSRQISNGEFSGGEASHSDDDSGTSLTELPLSQQLTQPIAYSQDSTTAPKKLPEGPLIAVLDDVHPSSNNSIEIRKSDITIGRSRLCDVYVADARIGKTHCTLTFMEWDGTCYLSTGDTSTCWIWKDHKWITAKKDNQPLSHRQRFRLLPAGKNLSAFSPGVEYVLNLTAKPVFTKLNPGSHSFDVEYLKLLRSIDLNGEYKTNKKGDNYTLPQSHELTIDLRDPTGKNRNLLPLTTLRNLAGGRQALVEAMWYLRGEDHISFLQKHTCKFWDRQAKIINGVPWVGFNYGLLTNFPQSKDQRIINQLELRVIQKLLKPGSSSRNMVCSLDHPAEKTVQAACTSSIQFSVSQSQGDEYLDLSITQRSSDVIVGLPHDVVVWSLLLHLVRREVLLRSRRKLLAGRLCFSIARNAAHVYKLNQEAMKTILERKPFENCQPDLILDEQLTGDRSMFDLAQNFEKAMFKIRGYTSFHQRIELQVAVE